jgi:hypothetical protein
VPNKALQPTTNRSSQSRFGRFLAFNPGGSATFSGAVDHS